LPSSLKAPTTFDEHVFVEDDPFLDSFVRGQTVVLGFQLPSDPLFGADLHQGHFPAAIRGEQVATRLLANLLLVCIVGQEGVRGSCWLGFWWSGRFRLRECGLFYKTSDKANLPDIKKQRQRRRLMRY
jgi:hypothetical protein